MANLQETNAYSPRWFECFHVGIPDERTEQECAFVRRECPLPAFRRVLDVCCGMGRHARRLAAEGYTVAGVERDARAVAAARGQGGGPVYVQSDVRDYQPEPGAYDAVIVMSQSFGYFEAQANQAVLARLAEVLRPGGRLILDLWNPAFFLIRQGQRTFELPAGTVRETTQMDGSRLFSRLDYPDGGHDAFDFQTFSAAEMAAFVQPVGMRVIISCTDFDAAVPPSADKPRIQFVLERP